MTRAMTCHEQQHSAPWQFLRSQSVNLLTTRDMRDEKTDLKVFVVVIPKEGRARMAALILLLA